MQSKVYTKVDSNMSAKKTTTFLLLVHKKDTKKFVPIIPSYVIRYI